MRSIVLHGDRPSEHIFVSSVSASACVRPPHNLSYIGILLLFTCHVTFQLFEKREKRNENVASVCVPRLPAAAAAAAQQQYPNVICVRLSMSIDVVTSSKCVINRPLFILNTSLPGIGMPSHSAHTNTHMPVAVIITIATDASLVPISFEVDTARSRYTERQSVV